MKGVYSKILIAVDGSSFSKKVAAAGSELAVQMKASFAFIYVVNNTFAIAGASEAYGSPSTVLKEMRKDGQSFLKKVAGKIKSNPEKFLEEGNPATEILNKATEWGADLIVVGTHGRTGLSRIVMGSVANEIVRHSQIPILVVPLKEKSKN